MSEEQEKKVNDEMFLNISVPRRRKHVTEQKRMTTERKN